MEGVKKPYFLEKINLNPEAANGGVVGNIR